MMKPAILLALVVAACAADSAPNATIESVTPDQLMASDDSRDDLTITVRYEDGDGDLGGGVAEVHDCRAADVVLALAIPEIAAEPDLHITGTLELHVNDIGAIDATALPRVCRDLGVSEIADGAAVFCVVLADAGGLRGEGDCTPEIELSP
jgi:hypothetical protein